MKRFRDWEQRLSFACMAVTERPHAWGTHDCALYAADCVLAMTGVDLAEDYRGRYTTPVGAARMLKRAGVDNLGDFAAQMLPEIDIRAAGRGDLLICDGPEGEFFAIKIGHMCVGPSATGVLHVPVRQATRAFKVG